MGFDGDALLENYRCLSMVGGRGGVHTCDLGSRGCGSCYVAYVFGSGRWFLCCIVFTTRCM